MSDLITSRDRNPQHLATPGHHYLLQTAFIVRSLFVGPTLNIQTQNIKFGSAIIKEDISHNALFHKYKAEFLEKKPHKNRINFKISPLNIVLAPTSLIFTYINILLITCKIYQHLYCSQLIPFKLNVESHV